MAAWLLVARHAARAHRSGVIRQQQLITAARTVADLVDDDDRSLGRVLPPPSKLPEVAKSVASAVARQAYDCGTATALPKPTDIGAFVEKMAYRPDYVKFA